MWKVEIIFCKLQLRYETENGILAEEQAVVGRDKDDNSGTSGQGFYQYIGDDDRVYRVEYTVGEQGFVPKVLSNGFLCYGP